MGFTLIEAAQMCATTPARELGLHGSGVIARDAVADLVVLDADLNVVETYISGHRVQAS
jgi:N-acetylglucosamine-6-phosphate deacetylase